MQNGCSFDVTFDYSSPRVIRPPSSLMQVPADDLFIEVELHPFMKSRGTALHFVDDACYVPGDALHSVGDVWFEVLQWRTVPVNPRTRWEFNVYYKSQIREEESSPFSPPEKIEPTPKIEDDGKFLNLPSDRNDAPEAKRSNSMKGLKKKMHLGSD